MVQQLCTMLLCQARVVGTFWVMVALHHTVTQGILKPRVAVDQEALLSHSIFFLVSIHKHTLYSLSLAFQNSLTSVEQWWLIAALPSQLNVAGVRPPRASFSHAHTHLTHHGTSALFIWDFLCFSVSEQDILNYEIATGSVRIAVAK